MSVRSELVALLRAGVPAAWNVRDFDADDLGNLTKVTITVQTTAITTALTFGTWDSTVVVDVVAPQESFTAAEEELEAAFLAVLAVLREAPQTKERIDGAQRIVRAERHHAWRFNLTIPVKEQ